MEKVELKPGTGTRDEPLIDRIWSLLEPVARSEGMEILEVEYRRESIGWVLRLFIDREEGVSVDDCARVSRVAGDLLDVSDMIPNPYHLEVSSPGLNRPLRKWEHFQMHLGRIIDLRTATAIRNRRKFKGILKEVDPEKVIMDCDGQLYEIPHSIVERARLCYNESVER